MESFSDFVTSRGSALWRSAWLLTGDTALAEDLLQTALARSWPHFDRVDSFEAYVRRTLYTTYASWWRRRWRHEIPMATPPDDVASNGHDAALSEDVRRALATLSPRQRAVIVLRYFEDRTEPETARTLGCSVGSVKAHHSRALARLRDSTLLLEEP